LAVRHDKIANLLHEHWPLARLTEGSFESDVLAVTGLRFTDEWKTLLRNETAGVDNIKSCMNSSLVYISDKRLHFGVATMSGGQYDAFYSLLCLHLFDVALLDEPGQNLGAHERSVLRSIFERVCSDTKRQLIVVTHHTEMLQWQRKKTPYPLRTWRVFFPDELSTYYNKVLMTTRVGDFKSMKDFEVTIPSCDQ
jgi:hypothetical protein